MAAMPFRLPDLGPDKRRLLGSSLLAFGLVGMALSLYGPAFPALQGRFDIGAQAVGLIVSLHFLGGFVAVVTIGPVIARLGYRRPLASAAALAAVGSAGVALGPGWELVLIGAFLLGLGLGFLDIGLNLLLVRSFDEGVAPVLNLLHALFGLGAVLGPALMAAFIPRFGPPFVLVSFASLALVPLALGLTEPPRPEPASGRLICRGRGGGRQLGDRAPGAGLWPGAGGGFHLALLGRAHRGPPGGCAGERLAAAAPPDAGSGRSQPGRARLGPVAGAGALCLRAGGLRARAGLSYRSGLA